MDIGKLYSIMIEDCAKPGEEVQELIKLFSSFISDEISNFNTDLYYQDPDYLECSYREGRLLDYAKEEQKVYQPMASCFLNSVTRNL